ncbi:MAG: acyl carrier protein [Gemmatimonadetes bacterium]|nr:acyl carrier protein [Gemmatimonadota bacterium]
MNRGQIEARLIAHIESVAGAHVTNTTHLIDEQILDSMGFINLIAFIETEFGVSFEESELDECFETIGMIAGLVLKKRV